MKLTDTELGLLEQLTYIKETGLNLNDCKGLTIKEILERFTEEELKKIEKKKSCDAAMSGKEVADIIRTIKKSERLTELKLTDTMKQDGGACLAACFIDDKEPNKAIIAFKGTTGKDEWADNASGFNKSDTACQIDALNYINSLKYTDITVTGHSKGGNKAMYVAITSEKVSRCVAFDGQGFSQEFLDKYWAEINQRGNKITSYSLRSDFVHILMFPIPTANNKYCNGYGVDGIGELHAPNSFFVLDPFGNILLDKNGKPIFTLTSEDEGITYLHDFTSFVLNTANDKDKIVITNLLEELLGTIFDGNLDEGDKKEEILNIIGNNSDGVAKVLAYFSKYIQTRGLSKKDIKKIMHALKLNDLLKNAIEEKLNIPGGMLEKMLEEIISLLLKGILKIEELAILLCELGIIDSSNDFVEEFMNTYSIINASGKESYANAQVKQGKKYDYSQKVYNAVIDVMKKIDSESNMIFSEWNNYSSEEWYSELGVSIALRGFKKYFDTIISVDNKCKRQIDKVFREVSKLDKEYAKKINDINISANKETDKIAIISAGTKIVKL